MRLCTGSGCPELIKKGDKFILKDGKKEIIIEKKKIEILKNIVPVVKITKAGETIELNQENLNKIKEQFKEVK